MLFSALPGELRSDSRTPPFSLQRNLRLHAQTMALRRWIKLASGQTPPIAMKPAGRLLSVLIRANRLDAGAPILSERLPEAIADIGVASAGKFIERDLAQRTRLELASWRSSSNIKTPDARAVHKKS